MNIFVCVKQVPDTETKVVPSADKIYIETKQVKWVMNPYDEFAVEQALLIKGKDASANITVMRVGSVQASAETLRTAMAMGADDAVLVESPDNLDSFMIAKALKGAIEKLGKQPDLILCGKQAVDDDCSQVPQILAQMLNLPSVSVVNSFEWQGNTLTLKREIEGGSIEVYSVNTPSVVSVTKGLNQPRYASLPGIMKAKKKPLAQYPLSEVGVSEADRKIKYSNVSLPPEKPKGKKFEAMDEKNIQKVVSDVASLLRNEAKVI